MDNEHLEEETLIWNLLKKKTSNESNGLQKKISNIISYQTLIYDIDLASQHDLMSKHRPLDLQH